jgi:hypothetical protein
MKSLRFVVNLALSIEKARKIWVWFDPKNIGKFSVQGYQLLPGKDFKQ